MSCIFCLFCGLRSPHTLPSDQFYVTILGGCSVHILCPMDICVMKLYVYLYCYVLGSSLHQFKLWIHGYGEKVIQKINCQILRYYFEPQKFIIIHNLNPYPLKSFIWIQHCTSIIQDFCPEIINKLIIAFPFQTFILLFIWRLLISTNVNESPHYSVCAWGHLNNSALSIIPYFSIQNKLLIYISWTHVYHGWQLPT